MRERDSWPPHRELCPLLFQAVCGLFNVPQIIRNRFCETGGAVYRPNLRRLESLTVCRCNYNYFKTMSVGLNPRPPKLYSGALQTELTAWWSTKFLHPASCIWWRVLPYKKTLWHKNQQYHSLIHPVNETLRDCLQITSTWLTGNYLDDKHGPFWHP